MRNQAAILSGRRTRNRRGAAILLSMLAAAIVATAAIAILRAGQRQVMTTRALEDSIRGDQKARGLMEMAIAQLRKTPSFTGQIQNKYDGLSTAYAVVTRPGKGTFRIDVYLYEGSPQPAKSIVSDNSLLKR